MGKPWLSICVCAATWVGCGDDNTTLPPDAAPPDSSGPVPVTFRPQVSYSTKGTGPFEIGVHDFDGDGFPDLAAVNNAGSSLATFHNNGDATFASAVLYPTSQFPITIQITDINGDTKPDLISSNGIHLNLGNGTFANETSQLVGVAARAADFNSDGKLDLVNSLPGQFSVEVLLGDSAGAFPNRTAYPVASTFTNGLLVGDINGDGNRDVVVAVTGNSSNPRRAVSVALGTGSGTLGTYQETELGVTSDPIGLALGDLDGDGHVDLVSASAYTLVTTRGRGDGTFDTPKHYMLAGTTRYPSVEVADINNDGKPDVAVTQAFTKSVGVFLNRGDGSLANGTFYPVEDAMFVTTFDLDKNGRLDLLVSNRQAGTVSVLLQE